MLGCGRCPRCAAGRGHVCASRREVGIVDWPGALAEQVLVRASSLYRLPDAIDDRSGALVEPGGNGWRAASAAQAGPGKRILVCGPGTIGLLTTAFATAMGAEVDIWALARDREELAAAFGASGYWTADDPPPGSYDAVVDCTDDHRMPAAALARAEPAGRLVYIGIAGVPSPIDSRDLVLGDMTAVGILGASAGLGPAIEHYADGRVDPSRIVAVTVGLEDAAEALAGKISTGAGTKILIDPCRLGPPARGRVSDCRQRPSVQVHDERDGRVHHERDGPRGDGGPICLFRGIPWHCRACSSRPTQPPSGVTELRVHGVGGSPPDATLGDLAPEQVMGDAIAGFYRSSDHAASCRDRDARRDVDRHVEVYLVGRPDLTEQDPGAVAGAAAVPVRQPGGLDVLGRHPHFGLAVPAAPAGRRAVCAGADGERGPDRRDDQRGRQRLPDVAGRAWPAISGGWPR